MVVAHFSYLKSQTILTIVKRGFIQQLIETERNPQPNIRWNLGNPAKEREKRMQDQRSHRLHKKTHRIN